MLDKDGQQQQDNGDADERQLSPQAVLVVMLVVVLVVMLVLVMLVLVVMVFVMLVLVVMLVRAALLMVVVRMNVCHNFAIISSFLGAKLRHTPCNSVAKFRRCSQG